ncbi:MAG: hypothetical protein HY072_09115 [Deltaproteobacteria bacterium]|nr:hypothetical protein [Deltaproteobacteria bacterium]
MAKRLGVLKKRRTRDLKRDHSKGVLTHFHKIAVERSRKAKLKKANPMC